ncbi:MAG: PEGA domain-containing protein [Gemmataceae bacterium]
MRRFFWLMNVAVCAGLAAGCVDRRFVVTTDPPSALVLVNNQPLTPSPTDGSFVYYGNYDFTIIKEGYETLKVKQEVPAPWYEYPPLDFISECLIPWRIKDVRHFHYQLQPLQTVRSDELLHEAEMLRQRGRMIHDQENLKPKKKWWKFWQKDEPYEGEPLPWGRQ